MFLDESTHLDRRATSLVAERLTESPVVVAQGPRSVGKSTLLHDVATTTGSTVIDFDDPEVVDAYRADPKAWLDRPAPVCIDEYQREPGVLQEIKARLNRSSAPGAFLLAGSTTYGSLPLAAQSLTGRIHLLDVLPFSQGELGGAHESLLDDLLSDPYAAIGSRTARASTTTRADYIDRVVSGGLPIALQRPAGPARDRWFDDYLTTVLTRDVLELSRIRQRDVLPQLFQRLASQTGQVVNISRAAEPLGIDATTAENYAALLEAVFLIRRLPAWGTTLRSRATRRPKLHVLDSGVAARVLRLTPGSLEEMAPTALEQFGHLLESFVVGELVKQASWSDAVAGTGHWRTQDGDEVDFVAERSDGAIVAFEVKAGSRVRTGDHRPLRALRDTLGPKFLAGVVLCTATLVSSPDDRIHVMPIDTLWTPPT